MVLITCFLRGQLRGLAVFLNCLTPPFPALALEGLTQLEVRLWSGGLLVEG